MTKEVLIHIRGLHTPEGETGEEPLELITTGEYYSEITPTICCTMR